MDAWYNLNKKSTSGIDEVTAEEYQKDLEFNIQKLAERRKTKRCHTKLGQRCYIPKENGKLRPLGIPALEDKLVQPACATVLTAIYEEDFLENSYAYRPERSANNAVLELTFQLQYRIYGYGVGAVELA